MTREDILSKLHGIKVKVHLTYLPSEGAIECQYATSKGMKEEWLGIDEWPVSSEKSSDGNITYILVIDGEKRIFQNYQEFSDSFEKEWIGEVKPWEEYEDCVLEEMIEWVEELDDEIPFLE